MGGGRGVYTWKTRRAVMTRVWHVKCTRWKRYFFHRVYVVDVTNGDFIQYPQTYIYIYKYNETTFVVCFSNSPSILFAVFIRPEYYRLALGQRRRRPTRINLTKFIIHRGRYWLLLGGYYFYFPISRKGSSDRRRRRLPFVPTWHFVCSVQRTCVLYAYTRIRIRVAQIHFIRRNSVITSSAKPAGSSRTVSAGG